MDKGTAPLPGFEDQVHEDIRDAAILVFNARADTTAAKGREKVEVEKLMVVNARPSHAARVDSSPRLRALLSALLKAGDRGLTTREIFDRTGSMAVHSDAHELRANGYRISCSGAGRTKDGRRVYVYRLVGVGASEEVEKEEEEAAL